MLKKTAISGLVWLTALSTLMAGSPHLSCRCPDGSIKIFCFGSVSSMAQSATSHKSCCGVTAHKTCGGDENIATPAPQKTAGPAFTAHSCEKSLVQAEAAVVVEGVGLLFDAGLSLSQNSLSILPASHCFTHAEWCYRSGTPPADLHVVFQHFLI